MTTEFPIAAALLLAIGTVAEEYEREPGRRVRIRRCRVRCRTARLNIRAGEGNPDGANSTRTPIVIATWSAREISDGRRSFAAVTTHGSGCIVRRLVLGLVLSAPLSMTSVAGATGEARTAKIVGLGAATCGQFVGDIAADPRVRRDYLAWAQGFMSGIILRRPPGVDEGLDLNPASFNLIAQLRFLEDHCAGNESLDFSRAVEALYRRLRQEGKT